MRRAYGHETRVEIQSAWDIVASHARAVAWRLVIRTPSGAGHAPVALFRPSSLAGAGGLGC